MKLFKKAQTATEYMIILAVIIIIALIVVGVMGGIPGLGGGARSRASSAYWQTADIGIVAYSVGVGNGTDDSLTLELRNNLRDSITITNINLDGDNTTFTDTVLAPGETTTYTETDWDVTKCSSAGDSYTLDVAINYTDDETGASYEFTGEGNQLEGTCAT